MPHIATIKIVVNDDDPKRIEAALLEMLEAAKAPVDPDQEDQSHWIVDTEVESIEPLSDVVNASIATKTYAAGEAFRDWVIYSRSEANAGDENAGYWSNDYGWTVFDLATRFDPTSRYLPMSADNDAELVPIQPDGRAPR